MHGSAGQQDDLPEGVPYGVRAKAKAVTGKVLCGRALGGGTKSFTFFFSNNSQPLLGKTISVDYNFWKGFKPPLGCFLYFLARSWEDLP